MKKTVLTLLGAVALVGCGGGGGGGGSSSSSSARIAFVNASPDAGAVAFELNGSAKATDVAYATATTFKSASAKDFDVAVRAADSSEDVWSESHSFAADTDTLAIAVGLRTPVTDDTVTPPVAELDKRLVLAFGSLDRTPPTGNRARVLVVNGFVRKAGFPTPAIDFRNPDTPPTTNVSNLAFGATSSQELDSGTPSFQVRQTGTDQVFVAATPLTLEPGKVYVALISGTEGQTGNAAPAIRLIPIATRK